VKLGNDVTLGDYVTLGSYVKLGNGVTLGSYVKLGNGVTLGSYVTLGNYVKLGSYVTSTIANEWAIAALGAVGATLNAVKWVAKSEDGRYWSLGIGSAKVIEYKIGRRISDDSAERSDIQCAAGIHVLPVGCRPDWDGFASPEDTDRMAALLVEYEPEDVLFFAHPGGVGKMRLKGCTPIREIAVPKMADFIASKS